MAPPPVTPGPPPWVGFTPGFGCRWGRASLREGETVEIWGRVAPKKAQKWAWGGGRTVGAPWGGETEAGRGSCPRCFSPKKSVFKPCFCVLAGGSWREAKIAWPRGGPRTPGRRSKGRRRDLGQDRRTEAAGSPGGGGQERCGGVRAQRADAPGGLWSCAPELGDLKASPPEPMGAVGAGRGGCWCCCVPPPRWLPSLQAAGGGPLGRPGG